MSEARRGTLFLVVGPSGAGKDTLIAAARAAFAEDPDYLFARRVVTRPAEAGGEAHEPATVHEFSELVSSGSFSLTWSAHGLRYGIRQEAIAALAAGKHVVVNLSRAVVAEARERFAPVVTIEVTAAREVLDRRLAARGRESADEIVRRLARVHPPALPGEVRRIDNSGDLGEAVGAFLAALRP
jgi:phosphonate metabolism protein PhnN/1,5-bisphosphokinase (PRPP-forming)